MANLALPCADVSANNLTAKTSDPSQAVVFGCNGTIVGMTTCPGLVLSEATIALFEGCTHIDGDLKIDATSDIVSLDHAALAGIVAMTETFWSNRQIS